jgi:hypothetical protein
MAVFSKMLQSNVFGVFQVWPCTSRKQQRMSAQMGNGQPVPIDDPQTLLTGPLLQPVMEKIYKEVILCTYSIDSSCELPPSIIAPGTALARMPYFQIVQTLTKVRPVKRIMR